MFCLRIHKRANRTINEKFNNERGEAEFIIENFEFIIENFEFIIENFEFIVRLASACIRKQNKNFKSLTLLIYNLSSLPRLPF